MIKWLTRITISETESQSFYHYMDNRVLPSSVDQERADRERWWYKPDFIINDLNLNSAITHPVRARCDVNRLMSLTRALTHRGHQPITPPPHQHRRTTRRSPCSTRAPTPCAATPTAGAAGACTAWSFRWTTARCVWESIVLCSPHAHPTTHPTPDHHPHHQPTDTHTHIQTWELAELSSEEYPTEHGRFWCWRLWTFEVDVLRLVSCKNVAVRGWDNSQNTQPRDLTWNVLGSKWMVGGLCVYVGMGMGMDHTIPTTY